MSRRPLLSLLVAALLALGTWAPVARADIFRLTYDEAAVDPAEGFDEECLGAEPAEDCDVRAALIQAELVALLSRLDSDRDPETLALFQAALELDSPVVQAMAARYVSRESERPASFLAKVKTFFWGPDAPQGVAAAEVLATSPDERDWQLAELYQEQRPSIDYQPEPVYEQDPSDEEPVDNRLLLACSQDARFELMQSFAEQERFEPAQRLLMYDRLISSVFEAGVTYPVTAFLAEASVEDVSSFFAKSFGDPLGPVGDSEARMQELTEELLALQGAAAGGDQAAIAEIGRISEELSELQEVVTLASVLQLDDLHARNDLVFLDGSLDDVFDRPLRAVTVGHDDLAGGTVIRYINGTNEDPGSSPDDGEGGAPGHGDEDPVGGTSGDEEGGPTRGSDGGCGCSVPSRPVSGPSLAGLLLLGWLIRRSRTR